MIDRTAFGWGCATNSASDEAIEIEARRICQNKGYDPEEIFECGPAGDYTEPEFLEAGGYTIAWPSVIRRCAAWKLFREDAEKILATK